MGTVSVEEYSDIYKEEVINLILAIQQAEFGIPITREDQPDLAAIEQFYQTGAGNFWVALGETHVVGTIALLDIGNKQAAIRKLFTNAAYRGSGYNTGKMLLEKLMGWAAAKGIEEIYLGTTEKFLAAHRFYEKNGFNEITTAELPAAFPVMAVDKKFYQFRLKDV
ncbi:GNAT family N-acetyltransferase [Sporomusa aerivorans]|uniref:GNAT family N-acetyltransferase n=1 Tax=Sporomusa aerivorans TaxID=204936 RepID=UPI00352BCD68